MARLINRPVAVGAARQFLVENRSGAGGNIAAEAVINSPPDGYTMLKDGYVSSPIKSFETNGMTSMVYRQVVRARRGLPA